MASAATADYHEEEHRIIKHDLVKVGVLNALYLAGVLALYFTNAKTHYLDRWFEKLLNF